MWPHVRGWAQVSALEEGLVVLMGQHRGVSAYAMLLQDHAHPSAEELLAAVSTAVQVLHMLV